MAALIVPLIAGVTETSAWYVAAFWSTVGAYIDSTLLIPTLFPPPDIKGQRLGDYMVQGADEGTPVNYALGTAARMAGSIIYMSDLIEVKDTESAGGKGGGGGDFITYTYYSTAAIALCRTFDGKPASRLIKLWADGKLLFDVAPDISITSTQISIVGTNTTEVNYSPAGGSVPVTTYYQDLESNTHLGGPDISGFKSGKNVEVTGATTATHNGTFKCVWAKTYVSGKTAVRLKRTNAAPGEAAGASITVYQKLPNFSSKQVTAIRFHGGGKDQQPDEALEAIFGVGNVPAHRKDVYVVLERLLLTDYGNRFPMIEALVEIDAGETVRTAMRKLIQFAGLSEGDYSVERVPDTKFYGYVQRGPQAPTNGLQQIATAFDIMSRYENGKPTLFPRSEVEFFDVASADLAANENGSETVARNVEIRDKDDVDLPSEVVVRYNDPDRDYQTSAQRARNVVWENDIISEASLDITIHGDEARQAAERLLWQSSRMQRAFVVSLPPSYYWLREGDGLNFTDNGYAYSMLCTRVERGVNGVIVAEGSSEDTSLTIRIETVQDPIVSFGTGSQKPYGPVGMVLAYMLDIPPLQDEHADVPGFYLACCMADRNEPWTGAILYESYDRGVTYRRVRTIFRDAVIGRVTTLPETGVTPCCWDHASEVVVDMFNGDLEGVTEIRCLNGENRALLGAEVVGFQDAESTGENEYTISTLIRGLRDRGAAIDEHVDGELFVLISGGGLQFIPINNFQIGTERLYKVVAPGGSLDDVDPIVFTCYGNSICPFAPAYFTGTRNGTNDLSIRFIARSRRVGRTLGVPTDTVEPIEEFDIEYLASPGGAVVAEETAVAIDWAIGAAEFTAAEQTAAGLTPGNPVSLRARQRSRRLRNGNAIEVTI